MRRMTKDGYYLNRHSCFLLQYHMVLVTKYRNPVLTGPVKEHIYSTIRNTMEEKEIRILEMNGEPDHIHILLLQTQICLKAWIILVQMLVLYILDHLLLCQKVKTMEL